jgi:hypothetical protein
MPNSHNNSTSFNESQSFKKTPVGLKVFGFFCLAGGLIVLVPTVLVCLALVEILARGEYTLESTTATVIFYVMLAVLIAAVVLFIVLGIRLLRNKRRHAAHTAEVLIVLTIAGLLCDIMLFGLGINDVFYVAVLVILIALTSYIDPSLSEERELQRKLRKMEDRSTAELGDQAGRDLSGKGYISLNFFNLFWIFVICCVLGLIIEVIYHFIVLGHYQDRAGLLFGPFSPIYGFGALLMTLALNRFHNKSIILVFFVSALIGGSFEYLVSWFMEFAFGITAWDYTGTWLSIDGRTNGFYMIAWGILGVAWIKLLLPLTLKLVNRIPWNLRYTLTTICAALMILDGAMTLMSLDFWYQRSAGNSPEAPVELFFAEHFDNDYMAERFQSMTINPETTTRTE